MSESPILCGIDFTLTAADWALPEDEFAAKIIAPAANNIVGHFLRNHGGGFAVFTRHTDGVLSVDMSSGDIEPTRDNITGAFAAAVLAARPQPA